MDDYNYDDDMIDDGSYWNSLDWDDTCVQVATYLIALIVILTVAFVLYTNNL